MTEKLRLDIAVYNRGLASSREKARGMIMAGEVMVNGETVDKAGTRVSENDTIEVKSKPPFVSRGGEKLAGALEDFAFDPDNMICADVGASTGGFTDCLLQNGADRIYAIDVGYGQIDYALRQDSRVILMERTNARYLATLPEPVNLVVIDASFISLKLLIPVVKNWLTSDGSIIALVKPQFEAGKKDVGKGGVVRDPTIHIRVLQDVTAFATEQGLAIRGLTRSRLKGPAGNSEFLLWMSQGHDNTSIDTQSRIQQVILV